jgi:hypothetical protein
MGIANPRRKIPVSQYNSHKSTTRNPHTPHIPESSFKSKALSLILDIEWAVKVPDVDGYFRLEMAMCPSCGNTKAEDHKPGCKLREVLDMR